MKRIVAASLFALACGPESDVASSNAAIINGVSDTADTSVVALIIYSSNGSQDDHVCSGTVVSPHVVLTAAHCLDPMLVGPVDHVAIFSGTDFTDPNQATDPTLQGAVASTVIDPKFSASTPNPTDDIALVVAAQPLALRPIALNHSSLGSGDIGTAVHAVGFGQTSDDPLTAGPRRSIDTTIFDIGDEHIVLDDVICNGDSGGPTFITKNGQTLVAGVHSFTASSSCIGDGDDTRVDRYASSVIDPVIDQFDPGFVPSGCNAAGSNARDSWWIVIALGVLARRKKYL